MKYIVKYETESKYLHFRREFYKEFRTFEDVRGFLIENVSNIVIYSIYKLTDLTNK